jgi:tRNA-splicing ligase RtcB
MEPEVAAAIERLRRAEDVARVAVMPDVHLAKDVCVGTVLATRRLLYPGAVGGDIGCGMLAVPFNATAELLRDPRAAAELLNGIAKAVPAMRRHRARTLPMPSELLDAPLGSPALESAKSDDGILQLGTLGGGNHFIEIQAGEDDRLWLMVHSGSRAMGQLIRGHYDALGSKTGSFITLEADSDAGRGYLADVAWARRYAEANRQVMASQVAAVVAELFSLDVDELAKISCDHNHVALEEHGGQQLWVHRKGAAPAGEGVAGVLPGSMGTLSYHFVGRGNPDAMRSSAHGAGRAMSRDAARRRFARRDLLRQMQGIWFDPRAADQLRDESPKAYKDVRAVLRAQHDLVRVTRTLRPLLIYKGT